MKLVTPGRSVALIAMLVVAACGGFAFTAANAPALFGDFERRANVAYGTQARQQLDVYSPKDAQSLPIIVFWYGGGWEKRPEVAVPVRGRGARGGGLCRRAAGLSALPGR